MQRNTEHLTPDAQSSQLTPTTENNLDRALYCEKQETEEEFYDDGVNIYIVSNKSQSLDTETHEEKAPFLKEPELSKNNKFTKEIRIGSDEPPLHFETEIREPNKLNRSKLDENKLFKTDYKDVPLPPSPKDYKGYRLRDQKRKDEDTIPIKIFNRENVYEI